MILVLEISLNRLNRFIQPAQVSLLDQFSKTARGFPEQGVLAQLGGVFHGFGDDLGGFGLVLIDQRLVQAALQAQLRQDGVFAQAGGEK